MDFMAPIPGMSLTKEPGNSPWEQPPLYDRPEEALAFYMKRLTDEETLDDALFVLEQGFPLEQFISSMTSAGVMEGYHSLDVKMLIAPVLHEHFKALAEAAGIDLVEFNGPSKDERTKERDKKRIKLLLQKALDEPDEDELSPAMIEDAEDMLGEEPAVEALPPSDKAPLIKRRM